MSLKDSGRKGEDGCSLLEHPTPVPESLALTILVCRSEDKAAAPPAAKRLHPGR